MKADHPLTAAILGSATVRAALTNFARSVIYTTAPTFPMVAAMRAGYELLRTGATEQVRFEHFNVKVEERLNYIAGSGKHPASRKAVCHDDESGSDLPESVRHGYCVDPFV
jgi:7-keto-8-aminopelargonate synthetase-like enzyme